MSASTRHLVLFARRPALGAGKRRLAKEIGASAALRFQRFALSKLIRALAYDPRWRLWLCLTPASRTPREKRTIVQAHGDLGARLTALLKKLPPGPIVIIGGDAPQVTRADIAEAFKLLSPTRTVFGPAADGGFWLAGLGWRARRHPPFSQVRWSSAHTLSDVVHNLAEGQHRLMRQLEDVDDASSLSRVREAMKMRGWGGP